MKPSAAKNRRRCSIECRKNFGWHSKETKQKIAESVLNNPTRYWLGKGAESKALGTGLWMIGKKANNETKEKHRNAWLGERNPNWQGGITEKNKLARNCASYRDWRNAVFVCNNYTCQICGTRGGRLHVDHIKSFARYPDLRFNVSNGRTLCVECHKNTESYLNRWYQNNAA